MQIKICNLRSHEFSRNFMESVLATGFAVITHHGIDYGLIREAQEEWRKFFKRNQEYKNQFVNPLDTNMGYTGFGGEKGVGATKADLKEFYHWKPNQRLPSEVAALTQKLFYQMEGDVAPQLLTVLNGIGSSLNYKEVCQNSNNTVIRALYYPALKDIDAEPGAIRSSAHEDINFITLLVAATSSGLQVQDKLGNWHDIPHEENSIVMNIGDMLQLASNYVLKSTTHRVVNPDNSDSDRISIPLFVHPHGNTLLKPGYTAQQYLNERLSNIYGKEYKK